MNKNRLSVLTLIYAHPENYPPTLNAIRCLLEEVDEITILHLPHKKDQWKWAEQVELVPSGKHIYNPREHIRFSVLRKFFIFFYFALKAMALIRTKNPSIVLAYDAYPLAVIRLLKVIIPKSTIVWYHNHDVSPKKRNLSKFSLHYWVVRAEEKELKRVNYFTLPSIKRLPYFNLKNFTGQIIELPNFPSLTFFNGNYKKREITNQLELLFIGSIAKGRGLEEIISMLPISLNGIEIKIKIVGFIGDTAFWQKIQNLVVQKNISEKVSLLNPVSYDELPSIAKTSHVGIAYYLSDSVMDKTISTASNKMYEYAALGMPVISSDLNLPSPEYRKHWQINAPLEREAFIMVLKELITRYDSLSSSAYKDFKNHFNFEKAFIPFLENLLSSC